MRDIVEVLGVGGDLLEQGPGGVQGGQVLFLLVAASARAEQAVLAQDALDGGVAERQVPFALQAAGSEGRPSAATRRHDVARHFAGDLVRAGARSARELLQPFQTLGLITSQPLAHGGHGGAIGPGRSLDPVLASVHDQAEAIIKSVLHLTNHIEVRHWSGHGPRILSRPAAALVPPPPRQPSLASSSRSHTSVPQGGYDVPRQSQVLLRVPRSCRVCYDGLDCGARLPARPAAGLVRYGAPRD